MKKTIPFFLLLLLAPSLAAGENRDRVQDLQARRARVVKAIGKDGVLLLRSRPPVRFSNDVFYEFRQENNLYYLTGLNQPGTVLLVSGRRIGNHGHAVVFLRTARRGGRAFANPRPTAAEVAARTGLREDAVLGPRDLESVLYRALAVKGRKEKLTAPRTFYYDHRGAARAGVSEQDPVQKLVRALRRERSGRRKIKPPRRVLRPLRAVKSAYEIACMRKAIQATEAGLRAALREIRPGRFEYEIEAVIEYHYRRLGCEGMAFPSIVGSGPNACIPHYTRNRRRMEGGELVVMDVGGDYRHYAADITRTAPVSGTFTARQRTIYELVLKAQRAGIEAVRPGAAFQDPDRAARKIIAEGLKKLGLIRRAGEVGRYFRHGTSHAVGLDVHDVGVRTLVPGVVLTVEPGIYIPEEAIGVRIEDDVLVTETGREVLSRGVPKTVRAIEALMAGGDR